MVVGLDIATALRSARVDAGLSQAALAERTGTSQATVSAYENGRKIPGLPTLTRLLAAVDARLVIQRNSASGVREPTAAEHEEAGRRLLDVITLAEALPVRHERKLRFPRLSER